jgi:hypothetical protein
MTQTKNWFNSLLISVKCALQTCNIEVLRPGIFTLDPLRLIARKLAILILTQPSVVMDTSLGGHHSGSKINFFPKFKFP